MDSTYKVNNFDYKISGLINEGKIEIQNPIKNSFLVEEIKQVFFSDLQITTNFKPKKINFFGKGKYSFDNLNFLKINFENKIDNGLMNLILNLDFTNSLEFNIINYVKPKNSKANLSLELIKKNDTFTIKNLNLNDDKNSIIINDLLLKKNELLSFKKIKVSTLENDFVVQNEKKIIIKGNKFDASNLAKFFNTKNNGNNNFKT